MCWVVWCRLSCCRSSEKSEVDVGWSHWNRLQREQARPQLWLYYKEVGIWKGATSVEMGMW